MIGAEITAEKSERASDEATIRHRSFFSRRQGSGQSINPRVALAHRIGTVLV